jgi:N-acetylglucosamine-6-sulfatase
MSDRTPYRCRNDPAHARVRLDRLDGCPRPTDPISWPAGWGGVSSFPKDADDAGQDLAGNHAGRGGRDPLEGGAGARADSPRPGRHDIILILADDHRHDAAGFMGHPDLETPNLDRMSRAGMAFANAFVTTSLCSPSRASILPGHSRRHGVIDNDTPVPPTLWIFPESLHEAGYRTAFIGKWHMGDTDAPWRGFDRWVSFKGQGTYWPDGRGTARVVPQTSNEGFNVDGRHVPQRGYINDGLTDYGLDWLARLEGDTPYFLYLSHKAVHSDFVPADRHRGRYADRLIPLPAAYPDTPENHDDKPM